MAEADKEGAGATSAKPGKQPLAKALDSKRSNAIGILISRLPPLQKIRTAITTLDESMLEREQVDQMRALLGTTDEMEEIWRQDGAEVKWDRPEAYLKVIMAIPRIGSRLQSWSALLCNARRI